MRTVHRIIVLLIATSLFVPGAIAQTTGAWFPLFNGKDLDGWAPKFRGHELGANYNNTFRVEDGLLRVVYDEYAEFNNTFGHLFYKDAFSHYRLRVVYRFVGEQVAGGAGWALRNNGLMLHGQAPETMTRDQSFPVSIEAQLLGGDGARERPTLAVCTPGTHVVIDGELVTRHCIDPQVRRTFHGDDWVTVEIEVRGNEVIRHIHDGVVLMEYTQPQLDPDDSDAAPLIEARNGELALDRGTISIQAESHPTDFRSIEIMILEP
jgi:hypothetical protein